MATSLKTSKTLCPGTWRCSFATAILAFLAVTWMAAGAALAGMSLMDEDNLDSVQGQTGLSMVARVRTTGGGMRITTTSNAGTQGYLDFGTVTINNSGSGFGRIGDVSDPALLDVGRAGTAVRMKLQLPSGYSATQTPEVPSIQGTGVLVNGQLIGNLRIDQIYQDRSSITAWCHSDGMDLYTQLRGNITTISLTCPSSNAALILQNNYFMGTNGGTHTAPTLGTGYFTFGLDTNPMQIDIFTGTATAATDDSIIRITYPVSGTFIIGNGRITNPARYVPGNASAATTNDYGPLIMQNMSGGEVTIMLPVTSGYVNFYPDV